MLPIRQGDVILQQVKSIQGNQLAHLRDNLWEQQQESMRSPHENVIRSSTSFSWGRRIGNSLCRWLLSLRVPPHLRSAREAIRWVNWGVDAENFSTQT